MNSELLVKEWFEIWESGKFMELPLTNNFTHHSPFGKIEGKKAYLDLVNKNKDKFLGHSFELLDAIYEKDRACVRYKSVQGDDYEMEVSEWYYIKENLVEEIHAYYHIGEIRKDRELAE